jgi:hypothetical protein
MSVQKTIEKNITISCYSFEINKKEDKILMRYGYFEDGSDNAYKSEERSASISSYGNVDGFDVCREFLQMIADDNNPGND